MSLVCTFVAIVTRLGLRAAPVGFPGHVHAWITDGIEELHVDVFHSDGERFLDLDGMRQMLDELQVPRDQQGELMRPTPASDVGEFG
jgi:hypothetical protein